MENLKAKLLENLISDDWKQLEVIARSNAWWAAEHWKIQSTRETWATEVYLNFIVEPVWDAPRPIDQAIKLITATAVLPDSEEKAVDSIARIEMNRPLDMQVKQVMPFIFSLNIYRRTQCIDV